MQKKKFKGKMNKALNLRDFTKDNLYPIYTKEKLLTYQATGIEDISVAWTI